MVAERWVGARDATPGRPVVFEELQVERSRVDGLVAGSATAVVDVASLLADTALDHLALPAGSAVRASAEGYGYIVADEAATDADVETAGGLKLYVDVAGSDAVGYRPFGATLAGVAGEDDAAIAAAHARANALGLRVVAEPGTFKPATSELDIPLDTDADLSRLTVLFDDDNLKSDGYSYRAVYESRGARTSLSGQLLADLNARGIQANEPVIPELAGHDGGVLFVETDAIDVYRANGSTGPTRRRAQYSFFRGGRTSVRTGIEISAGTVSAAHVIPQARRQTIHLPRIQTTGTADASSSGHQLLIVRDRYAVNLIGLDATSEIDVQRRGRHVFLKNVGHVRAIDWLSSGRSDPSDGAVYLLHYEDVVTLSIEGWDASGGWGVTGGTYIAKLRAARSTLNRLDVHWQGGDVTATDCTLTDNAIVLGGIYGTVRARGCTKLTHAGADSKALIATRTDYGGVWFPGASIHVDDATIRARSGEITYGAVLDLGMGSGAGMDAYIPDIYVDGVKFERVRGDAIVADLIGSPDSADTDHVYLPRVIDIKNVNSVAAPESAQRTVIFDPQQGERPYFGQISNVGFTTHNVEVYLAGFRGAAATVEYSDAAEDYIAHWETDDAPYPRIDVADPVADLTIAAPHVLSRVAAAGEIGPPVDAEGHAIGSAEFDEIRDAALGNASDHGVSARRWLFNVGGLGAGQYTAVLYRVDTAEDGTLTWRLVPAAISRSYIDAQDAALDARLTRLSSTAPWRISAASIGIVEANDDAAQALLDADAALRQLAADHGSVEVVFDGGTFDWGARWDQPSGVNLLALRPTTLIAKASMDRMIQLEAGAVAGAEGKFIFDLGNVVQTVALDAQQDSVPKWVGLSFRDTGADVATAGPNCMWVGWGSGAEIADIDADGCGRVVQLRGDGGVALGSTDVDLRNLRQTNPREKAELLQINKHAKRVKLDGWYVGAHASNVLGGHPIQTMLHEDGTLPTIEDLIIENGTFEGLPGVAWSDGIANGAHGDVIALRGVKRARIRHNRFFDAGEYGADVLQGCEDVWIYLNHFERIDGSAVIVGSSGTATRVKRTRVFLNTMLSCGLNQANNLGPIAASIVHAKNDDDSRIERNDIDGGVAFGIYIAKTPQSRSIFVDCNSIRNTAAQANDLPPIYMGQVTAPAQSSGIPSASRDTAHLSNSANIPTATGIVDGLVLPAGPGDLEIPVSAHRAASGWRPVESGTLSIVGNGTMNLAWSGGTYVGPYRGEMVSYDVPAQAAISFRHILSGYDGTGASQTTNVDPTIAEETLGSPQAPSGNAQAMRVYLHPPSGRFYLQRGQKSYTAVNSTGTYQSASEPFVPAALMDDCLFLGVLVVHSTATDLDSVSDAVWLPTRDRH